MAIYMEFDGGNLKGDSTAESHPQWITLQSVQWGIGRGISTPTGSAENREASTCSVSEVTVSKSLDAASGPLWQELVKNTDGKDVQIDFTATSDAGDNTFMFIKMTNTLVSGMSFSSGGDRPSESISLNFTKLETKYLEQAFTGTTATGGSVITYDLALSKAT